MFLVNPISGALHKLPPFKTIPCFREFIKTREWKRSGANEFCHHIAVDSIDSNNWTMAAAVLSDHKTLGLCKPGDKTWIVFQSGDNGLEVKLKLVLDKHEILNGSIDEYHSDYAVVYNSTYRSWLSECTNNEVLVIHQMNGSLIGYEGNHEDDNAGGNVHNNQEFNNGDGGLTVVDEYDEDINIEGIHNVEEIYDEHNGDEENMHQDRDDGYDHVEDNQQDGEQVEDEDVPVLITSSFRAYKIDKCKDKLMGLQCLGDQLLFLGEGGSFSLPANDFQELGKNCIYFATHFIQEIGKFYLDPGSNGERKWPVLAPKKPARMLIVELLYYKSIRVIWAVKL
ncbi:hypothetical protein ACLB2K_046889 [Fragaria x ananassa]